MLHNGAGAWDNADGVAGRNYTLSARSGAYALSRRGHTGSARSGGGGGPSSPSPTPEPRLLPPRLPLLLVSDLDGTLIGDAAGLRAFASFWRDAAAPTGSRLVFSTGRSLPSFLALAAELGEALPTPDALVCSVGTCVYRPTPGGGWAEDAGWRARLDRDWDLEAATRVVASALASAGADNAHWRPAEEQNGHKLTVGVRASHARQVVAAIEVALAAPAGEAEAATSHGGNGGNGGGGSGGVSSSRNGSARDARPVARILVSGAGGWRYIDIVSACAGKRSSTEYVRASLFGFEQADTVVAGDSGNDIDMLGGRCSAVVVGNAQEELMAWAERARAVAAGAAWASPVADIDEERLRRDDGTYHDEGEAEAKEEKEEGEGAEGARGGASGGAPASAVVDVTPTSVVDGRGGVAVAQRPAAAAKRGTGGTKAVPRARTPPPPAAPPRLYIAAATHAAGVLEGLQAFGFA